jgi:hypothetical protein
MNALQEFVASTKSECGFLSKDKLAALIVIDPLCPVLVRCGGCRFTCGAQYVDHMLQCITAGGNYVRDVSLPTSTDAYAAAWRPTPPPYVDGWTREALTQAAGRVERTIKLAMPRRLGASDSAMERDFGGAFDGHTVTSDADPGL